MIAELDRVILTEDLPQYGLKAGDIRTVVLIHREGEGYEVEFTALDGETLAVTSVFASQVAQALRNAYLYQTLEHKVLELESVNNQMKSLQYQFRELSKTINP